MAIGTGKYTTVVDWNGFRVRVSFFYSPPDPSTGTPEDWSLEQAHINVEGIFRPFTEHQIEVNEEELLYLIPHTPRPDYGGPSDV